MTDTFLELLGLPPMAPAPSTDRTFCNGFENEDLDPIRRDCDAREQVCSNTKYALRGASPEGAAPPGQARGLASGSDSGDLGLLLAVTIPEDPPNSAGTQYQGTCPAPIGGAFKRAPMPFAIHQEAKRCPDGSMPKLGCLWPATSDSATGTFCLARKTNIPGVRPAAFNFMDGRVYNLIPRDPVHGTILWPSSTRRTVPDPRWGGGGIYKIHQDFPMTGGLGSCQEFDVTHQIACLVKADPCSIGFARREAISVHGTKALKLRSVLADAIHPAREVGPTASDIALLLDPSGQSPFSNQCGKSAGDGGISDYGYRYPLAHRLWINASKGLNNVADFVIASDNTILETREERFVSCLSTRSNEITDSSITARGFVEMPAGEYPVRACGSSQ